MPPNASPTTLKQTLRSALMGSAALANHYLRTAAGSRQRYILVLSHMRSGSSLLHHVLQTHPAVLGAGESNRVYQDAGDLRRLSLWAHQQRGVLLRWHPFVTDQLNHNEKLRSLSLLMREDVSTIILIRQPLATVASIVQLSRDFYRSSWDAERATHYYLARIERLAEAAAAIRSAQARPPMLLTYENLTQHTPQSLLALQSYLTLDRPLSSEYETLPFTGRRGDPSARIRAGRVLPRDPGDAAAVSAISAEQRGLLEARYERTMHALRDTCGGPMAC